MCVDEFFNATWWTTSKIFAAILVLPGSAHSFQDEILGIAHFYFSERIF
jgi:hypothetical protein